MDFDKIKKAAKDTIKMVSNKVEEKLSKADDDEDVIEIKGNRTVYDDFDDFSENDDDIMGTTQRFDMKDALNRFRKRQDNIEETLSDLIKNNDKKTEDKTVNDFIESNFTDLKKDLSDSISDIDSDISNLSANYSQEMKKIETDISNLREYVDNAVKTTEKTNTSLATLSDNLEASILDINKKLSEITTSISGVNRINDSIFDLKNSQINTKNFLGDLEAAFKNLKKKMTAGITILSVITAVIAILEVLNLLS